MRVTSLLATMLVAGATAVTAAAQLERTPQLRLVSGSPLVVAGSGFKARERVTVSAITAFASGRRVVRTRATQAGSFRVRLALFAQPCAQPYAITARGALGSIAVLPLQAPPCVPPPLD